LTSVGFDFVRHWSRHPPLSEIAKVAIGRCATYKFEGFECCWILCLRWDWVSVLFLISYGSRLLLWSFLWRCQICFRRVRDFIPDCYFVSYWIEGTNHHQNVIWYGCREIWFHPFQSTWWKVK
jgi:hypothetical protein